jgi:hypothetical protein
VHDERIVRDVADDSRPVDETAIAIGGYLSAGQDRRSLALRVFDHADDALAAAGVRELPSSKSNPPSLTSVIWAALFRPWNSARAMSTTFGLGLAAPWWPLNRFS